MNKLDIAKFEREIIQNIIHKQQDIRYKNYGWSVTLVIAITVASISSESKVPGYLYLCLNFSIVLMFGIFDIVHRNDFYKIVDRSRKVEEFMRNDSSEYDGPLIEETLMTPGIDRRVFKDIRFLSHYILLLTTCFGIFLYIQSFNN